MKRVSLVVLAGGLLLAACGQSGKETGTLTVKSIASASEGTTLRFSTETRLHGIDGMPYTGEVDADRNASIVMRQPGQPGEFDLVRSGRRLYNRVVSPDASLSYDWCEMQDVKTTKGYAGVAPFDTLANLDAEGRSLRRVGTERIRGVDTVHYAIDGADPPVDLWVDDEDRLRRLIWTHENNQETDTVELYDFGAPITVTVPEGAPPCPAMPPGLEGHCVLGQSYDELPKCPDDSEAP
jgi:hypothetical protein